MSGLQLQASTLIEAFYKRCNLTPSLTSIRYKENGEWQSVSYAQQMEAVRRLSIGLIDSGLNAGDRVAVLGDTSIDWIQIDHAVMGAKGVVIPIYPTNTPEDVEYILNHSETKVIFIDKKNNLDKVLSIWKNCPTLKTIYITYENNKKNQDNVFHINELKSNGLNQESKLSRVFEENITTTSKDDLFTICYTSGTTGQPKGVLLNHSCMVSAVDDCSNVINPHTVQGEKLLSFLPMSHVFGRFESYFAIYLGWTQAIVNGIDEIMPGMAAEKPTIILSVPRVFEKAYLRINGNVTQASPVKQELFRKAVAAGEQWLKERKENGSASLVTELKYQFFYKLVFSKIYARFGGNLKFCISGGAALAPEISNFMEMAGILILQGYGLTETCAPICVNLPDQNRNDTVGPLLPEVLVKIAQDGEILIKSDKVFKGYYKNEEATKESFTDEWFHSGDIGHLDSDGFLKITDRKKDLIKTSGGKYVAPQKIENAAKSTDYINQVVVYGDKKPYITALLTLDQEGVIKYAKNSKVLFSEYSELLKNEKIKKLIEEQVQTLNENLARWETVKKYHVLDSEFTVENGGLTPSMKIKRKHLTKQHLDIFESLYS